MVAFESAIGVIIVIAGDLAADIIVAVAVSAAVDAVAKQFRPIAKKSETRVPLLVPEGLNLVSIWSQIEVNI